MKEMSLEVKNIGLFQEKNILKISDLTLICGMNDSGKSTLNKIIYLLIRLQIDFRNYDPYFELKKLINKINKKLSRLLSYDSKVLDYLNISKKFEYDFNHLLKQPVIEFEKNKWIFIFELIRKEILMNLKSKEIEKNNFKLENLLTLYSRFADETSSQIFNYIRESRSINISFFDDINIFLKEYNLIFKILKDNDFNPKNISIFWLKSRLNKYIKILFGNVSDVVSKFNTSYNDSDISLNLFGNIIDISLKDGAIEINNLNMGKIYLKDVTYCEEITTNFNNNVFKRPNYSNLNQNIPLETQLQPYWNFYLKMNPNKNSFLKTNYLKYKDISLQVSTNVFDDEIDEIIQYILKLTFFEDGYNKKEQSYKKYGQFINEKNISKGISTFQAIIEMLKAGIFKENSFVILDEAENFLHPNMQNEFVKVLLLIIKKTGCKIIVTTHSPIIVDSIEFESKREKVEVSYNYLAVNKERTNSHILNFINSFEISKNLSEVYNLYE